MLLLSCLTLLPHPPVSRRMSHQARRELECSQYRETLISVLIENKSLDISQRIPWQWGGNIYRALHRKGLGEEVCKISSLTGLEKALEMKPSTPDTEFGAICPKQPPVKRTGWHQCLKGPFRHGVDTHEKDVLIASLDLRKHLKNYTRLKWQAHQESGWNLNDTGSAIPPTAPAQLACTDGATEQVKTGKKATFPCADLTRLSYNILR